MEQVIFGTRDGSIVEIFTDAKVEHFTKEEKTLTYAVEQNLKIVEEMPSIIIV